ncbi:MAG: RnfABCDGE type electron transport complex subunit D [Ruminococcaceae bacterium]|nr:RnfABCDGE type electron transport complex subunit D [Oscillospiraceae bacterium]
MDKMLKLSSSPHIHCGASTTSVMRDVIIALIPASIAGTLIFGLRSLLVIAVCVATCVLSELLFNIIAKKDMTIKDLSAAVTGLLLALNLPANIPVWQCVVGSLFAIVIVKSLFGGIGRNLVNPAITARVFMLVSFGNMAKQAFPKGVDTVSGATPLEQIANDNTPKLLDLFLGTTGGAIGETCAAALIIGFIYLLVRRVITWHIPVAFVGSVFVLSYFLEGFDAFKALALILSGGLMIGAVFMATDYVTSPSTSSGKIVFGIGAGILTVLIRHFGSYPEGVSFAILLMNILNPYIEKFTARKVFGGTK